MKFGHFDNAAREYVIERPDTPLPWINYLGNEQFFSMISNTAGGYSFMVDARKKRLTRYRYNNVPADVGGKYIYIRDEETGKFWSPTWQPTKGKLDSYTCRHGLGYTTIASEKDGISFKNRSFVPNGQNAEIWEVDIVNNSSRTRKLRLFSLVEFCLWEALTDMTNFQRTYNIGEVEVEDNVIYHTTEYRERRNHFAYFACSQKMVGFETDRDVFFGAYNGWHEPQVVVDGKPTNSITCGWNPIGSHCIELTLKPQETKQINFVLGYWENLEESKFSSLNVVNKTTVKPVIKQLLDRKETNKLAGELASFWDTVLGNFKVETPDAEVSAMVNIWNQYQCVVTYNMARSTSYYESGIGRGIGYRDACQDMYGAVHIVSGGRSRQRVLDLAAIQWRDGSTYHQFQPLTKRGNRDIGVGFNDDPLWLIMATATYIKETGDWSILDERVPFDNNTDDTGTLYEHLITSFTYIHTYRGPHGLPLIGRADWNDCLNLLMTHIEPGDTFQADAKHAPLDSEIGRIPESLMIAGQFVLAMTELSAMAKHRQDNDLSQKALQAQKEMKDAICAHGWDGEWFLRAYDRFGKKVGSKECEEGKIFIEPQVWMVWAGVGFENGYAKKAMDSVKGMLYSKHGIAIQRPAYTKYNFCLGEMTSYPPGVKENAGIFCQPNGWAVIAEAQLGRAEQAMEYYKTICPMHRESISDQHRCEPYIYSQMIAGPDSPRFGEAKNSWLTGTAASSFLSISQFILGIRPDYEGLKVVPCVPASWTSFKVFRRFRNCSYNIEFVRGDTKGAACSIELDGVAVKGNVIPIADSKVAHKVKVIFS